MELEITWRRVARIWCWLGLMSLTAVGVSLLAGAGISFIAGLLTGTIGFSLIFTRMILGRNFGEFRLALVPKETLPRISRPGASGDARLREHTFPRVPLTRRAKPEELDWAGPPVERTGEDVVLGEVRRAREEAG